MMNMQSVQTFVHAYRQAPWRVQRQWIGAFLSVVLGLAMVAALYLDVTAQAAISGRSIQDMTYQMAAAQHANADLQTKLGELTSNKVMEERALALGFQSVEPDQIDYLPVPGYATPQPEILTAAPALRPSSPSIPPEYNQSLIDWINDHIRPPLSTSMTGGSQ